MSYTRVKSASSVYSASEGYAFFRIFTTRFLRPTAIRCIASIFYNFFLRQFHAAWLPGRIPVSRVDHPLDQKIPFTPSWVKVYLDFSAFWIRMMSFLLRKYGRRSFPAVREFMESMNRLYVFAAGIYSKNLSTTSRPFYIRRPHFFFIHLLDPHLMCVPSLHVLVVIWTYIRFAAIIRSFGDEQRHRDQIEEMKQGALAITEAILFVKQHSVNCIPASLHAMTCFSPENFSPKEAEAFADLLFDAPLPASYAVPKTRLAGPEAAEIKAHIISLYRSFQEEGKIANSPEEPLLRFMKGLRDN